MNTRLDELRNRFRLAEELPVILFAQADKIPDLAGRFRLLHGTGDGMTVQSFVKEHLAAFMVLTGARFDQSEFQRIPGKAAVPSKRSTGNNVPQRMVIIWQMAQFVYTDPEIR